MLKAMPACKSSICIAWILILSLNLPPLQQMEHSETSVVNHFMAIVVPDMTSNNRILVAFCQDPPAALFDNHWASLDDNSKAAKGIQYSKVERGKSKGADETSSYLRSSRFLLSLSNLFASTACAKSLSYHTTYHLSGTHQRCRAPAKKWRPWMISLTRFYIKVNPYYYCDFTVKIHLLTVWS
jgi:hypothetical protein